MLLMARLYWSLAKDQTEPRNALYRSQLWLRDATAGELRVFIQQFLQDSAFASDLVAKRGQLLSEVDQWPVQLRPFAHPFFWSAFTYVGS